MAASGISLTRQSEFRCLRCSNPGVQSVSALVQQGSWTGASVGGGVAWGGEQTSYAVGVALHQGASNLASLIGPPPVPNTMSFLVTIALVWLILGAAATGMAVSESRTGAWNEQATQIAMVAAPSLPLLVVALIRWQRKRTAKWAAWRKKLERWPHLVHCSRCNAVSDLQANEWVPAENVRATWS